MTEEEELKQNTEIQKARQTFKEINDYLHELIVRMEFTSKRSFEAWIIYMVAWFIWVISGFFAVDLNNIFTMIFFFALVYQFYRSNELAHANAEFRGAVKILRIVGMLPPPADPVQNKVHFWEEGKELVRAWMNKKQKVQGEVYA